MQKSCHYRFQAALLLGALAAVPLARTQPLGSITGTITDPSGRTVAEAGIRVVDIATNAERKAVSDQEGRFLVADLPLGTYSLYVTHGGFQVSRMDGLALAAGRTLRVAVELKIGPSNETVAVTAEAQPVDTQAGAWADAVSQQQLAALPLNGRDVFDLAAQQVGVQTPPSANAAINTGLGIHISVNGSRPSENAFRLDGIYIDDAGGSAPASAAGYLLGLEAIAELNVVAAPFSAEYGRTDGGVLTAVSKSGTNDFHGALYEYVRNSDFDAKNFFDPTVGPIPAFRRNQFGGLLGGPILKDKLFFLLNYEGIRIASNDTATIVTPDAQARNGLLPVNGVLKQVPVAPKILPYLALYPLPNGADLGMGRATIARQFPLALAKTLPPGNSTTSGASAGALMRTTLSTTRIPTRATHSESGLTGAIRTTTWCRPKRSLCPRRIRSRNSTQPSARSATGAKPPPPRTSPQTPSFPARTWAHCRSPAWPILEETMPVTRPIFSR